MCQIWQPWKLKMLPEGPCPSVAPGRQNGVLGVWTGSRVNIIFFRPSCAMISTGARILRYDSTCR